MGIEFFQSRMDYVYFVYGLVFVLLAAVCISLRREKTTLLRWDWLALFGLFHGIHEWLNMLVQSMDNSRPFALIRLVSMVLSFLCLAEFGRSGIAAMRPGGPGRWVHLPLLVLAAMGGMAGMAGANAAARYALGFTGALWAAWALFAAARRQQTGVYLFRTAAWAMGKSSGHVVSGLPALWPSMYLL